MKKLLLCLLIALPAFACAQKWRIGLGGGVSFMSRPDGLPLYDQSRLRPGPALMFSVSRMAAPKLELGIDISAISLVRTGNVIRYTSPGIPTGTYTNGRVHIGSAAIMVTPFMSYAIHHFYVGPQLGVFTTISGTNDFPLDENPHVYYNDCKGYSAGIHAGFTKHILTQLMFYAEARVNYIHGTQKINGINAYGFNIIQGGLLAGLKYAF